MVPVKRTLAVVAAVLMALAAAEVGLRLLERGRPMVPAERPLIDLARRYVRQLPVADGVSREWFETSPEPLRRVPLPANLQQVADAVTRLPVSAEMFKAWNGRFIQQRVCEGDPFFQQFPGFAFAFDPAGATIYPRYRYLADIATPYGLVTNRFGFRGHDIEADKPPRVIRIAALGASTTVGAHGQAFSYPEFLEPWLNRWTAEHAPGVRVEVINAGREGITSADIAAIAKDEVMALEPDVFVYYEGANQFAFRDRIAEAGERIVVPKDLSARTPLPGARHSALLRRLDVVIRRFGVGSGTEPRKPKYAFDWPASVDEAHPNPDSPVLPLDLPRVVRDLDDIRAAASGADARLVVTSFIWMVQDGLVVDPVNDEYFFRMLNLQHWPARYADIRRMADLQNRVFRAYADARRLPFIDVAGSFPQDLKFFSDPVHTTIDGDRLRAWIVFQGLVPILRDSLASHRLPRADRTPFQGPPAAPVRQDPLVCTSFDAFTRVDDAGAMRRWRPSADGATVTGGRIVTPPERYGYAAEVAIPEAARVAGPGLVYMKFTVASGGVTIGVLSRDRSRFLQSRTYEAGHGAVEMRLPLPSMADAGALMVTNAVRADGERSVVDVTEAEVLLPNR